MFTVVFRNLPLLTIVSSGLTAVSPWSRTKKMCAQVERRTENRRLAAQLNSRLAPRAADMTNSNARNVQLSGRPVTVVAFGPFFVMK